MTRIVSFILAVLLVLSFFTLAAPYGLCDAGNFADGNDWGGDWGGGDWGGDWDGGGGGYGGSGGSSGDTPPWFAVVVFAFIVLIYFLLVRQKKGAHGGQNQFPTAQSMPVRPDIMDWLKKSDPNFSEQRILDMAGNLYVQMQAAWQAKDWEPMRTWMTDALFNQLGRQLDALKNAGRTNYVENIAVMDSRIIDCIKQGDMDVLKIRLTARIIDYTLDDAGGKLVSGSRTAKKLMTYDWTLIRKSGRLTQSGDEQDTVATYCSACGAALNLGYSGKCNYCGTVLLRSDYDWTLSSISGVSQRTIA